MNVNMSIMQIRLFGGNGKWPPTAPIVVSVDKTRTLRENIPPIIAGLKITAEEFAKYEFCPVVNKAVSAPIGLDEKLVEKGLTNPNQIVKLAVPGASPPPKGSTSKAPSSSSSPPPPSKGPTATTPLETAKKDPPIKIGGEGTAPSAPPAASPPGKMPSKGDVPQSPNATKSKVAVPPTGASPTGKKAAVKAPPQTLPPQTPTEGAEGSAMHAVSPASPAPKKAPPSQQQPTASSSSPKVAVATKATKPPNEPMESNDGEGIGESVSKTATVGSLASRSGTAFAASEASSDSEVTQSVVAAPPPKTTATKSKAPPGGKSMMPPPQSESPSEVRNVKPVPPNNAVTTSSAPSIPTAKSTAPSLSSSSPTKKSKHSKKKRKNSESRSDSSDKDGGDEDGDEAAEVMQALAENLSKSVEAKVVELHKAQIEEDKRLRDSLESKLSSTMTKELQDMKRELLSLWEVQRNAALKQQSETETMRVDTLRKIMDREAQLHKSQLDMMEKFQTKIGGGQDETVTQLAEIQAANKELRKQLSEKKQANESNFTRASELTQLVKIQEQLTSSISILAQKGQSDTAGHFETSRELPSLSVFLTSIGLEKYLDALQSQDVDCETLLNFNESELEKVGITTIGARKRILQKAQQIRHNTKQQQEQTLTHHKNTSSGSYSPEIREMEMFRSPRAPFVQNLPERNHHLAGSPPFLDEQMGHSQNASQVQQSFAVSSRRFSGDGSSTGVSPDALEYHTSILRQFFAQHNEQDLAQRVEEVLAAYINRLPTLYASLASKYKIKESSYRAPMRQILSEYQPDLLPANDVICAVMEGREAEFAESVALPTFGRKKTHHLTWYEFVPDPPAEPYFYNSLVRMSQRNPPSRVKGKDLGVVHQAKYSSQKAGGSMENPSVADLETLNTQAAAYIAETVAILIRKAPKQLTNLSRMLEECGNNEKVLYERVHSELEPNM